MTDVDEYYPKIFSWGADISQGCRPRHIIAHNKMFLIYPKSEVNNYFIIHKKIALLKDIIHNKPMNLSLCTSILCMCVKTKASEYFWWDMLICYRAIFQHNFLLIVSIRHDYEDITIITPSSKFVTQANISRVVHSWCKFISKLTLLLR